MMVEAPQITGLGQDGQRLDRTNARNVVQQLVVDVIGEPRMGQLLDSSRWWMRLRPCAMTMRNMVMVT